MSLTVTVLYPAKEGAKFDMDYYLKSHMPLVSKRWGPHGLKQWYVTDLRPSQGPYSVQATLIWETGLDGFQKANDEHGAEVMGDVVNFSSEQPVVAVGGIAAKMS
ncbi:hypothetical protein N0V82_003160 [Gnomoniopsis sp. IMI 355080]|nr:hypothetical protein N0V82_003160 [Gnomoniopsis sp. IMI 355080]